MLPPNLEQASDIELVRACRDLNSERFEEAFEALYVRYRDRAYSVAYRMTGTATDAMDVVQDAFSMVFRKIGGFRAESTFSTWLFRVVVNCSIDQQRRSDRQRQRGELHSLSQVGEGIEPQDEGQNPSGTAEVGELGDHVHSSLQLLSPKLRAILVLRYLEGLSYDELTHALGLSMGTVKSRLARAHAALESVLRGTLEPFGYPELDLDSDGREGVA